MDNSGNKRLIAFTGDIDSFTEQPVKLVRLPASSRKITPPAGTRWVETLSNPKQPNIWAGKGPSFDSDGVREYFWRVLENGHMTHYKNDTERATEMFQSGLVDEYLPKQGSHELMSMCINRDQEESRRKRNHSTKVTGIGKRIVPEKIWDYKTKEYRTRFVCDEHHTKGRTYDSHGPHGRKPHYKTEQGIKLSSTCPQTTREMKTDEQWAKEKR